MDFKIEIICSAKQHCDYTSSIIDYRFAHVTKKIRDFTPQYRERCHGSCHTLNAFVCNLFSFISQLISPGLTARSLPAVVVFRL